MSPLLTAREMEQIAAKVREYEHMPAVRQEDETFTRQLEEVNYMAAQIKSLIQRFQLVRTDETVTFEELLVRVGEGQTPYADRQKMIIDALKKMCIRDRYEYSPEYEGEGPMLYAEYVEKAEPIKEIVQF